VVKAFGQFRSGFGDKAKEHGVGGCTDVACYCGHFLCVQNEDKTG